MCYMMYSCHLVFERILHLGDLVFDLPQLPQHTVAVRARGSRELLPDIPDLVRNIRACELRDLPKVVWVWTSKWSAMFSKAECNMGEAYTFHSNALPNCNDSSVTLVRPCSKRRPNSPLATAVIASVRYYNVIPYVFEHGHGLQWGTQHVSHLQSTLTRTWGHRVTSRRETIMPRQLARRQSGPCGRCSACLSRTSDVRNFRDAL
jgi:hypothetical protein